jgi:hypothetical protein
VFICHPAASGANAFGMALIDRLLQRDCKHAALW